MRNGERLSVTSTISQCDGWTSLTVSPPLNSPLPPDYKIGNSDYAQNTQFSHKQFMKEEEMRKENVMGEERQ